MPLHSLAGTFAFVALAAACASPASLRAQEAPPTAEVRQLVTFLFAPGMADSAVALYRRVLVPAYRGDSALHRFRAYREAESPEPLDLVVVSSFAGMSGMDRSNDVLRNATAAGRPVFAWYGALSAIAQHHHDQFVEMRPALGDPAQAAADTAPGLTAFEYVRLAPGAATQWERLVETRVRPAERQAGTVRWSETGRLLVGDGWDYLRIVRVSSLGGWHALQALLDANGTRGALDRLVASRKVLILRHLPSLAVR